MLSTRVNIALTSPVATADRLLAELHGMEDGTIPATFQVIFLVRPNFPHFENSRLMTVDDTDRMEAKSESAKTFAAGKRTDEFERRSVRRRGPVRAPRVRFGKAQSSRDW